MSERVIVKTSREFAQRVGLYRFEADGIALFAEECLWIKRPDGPGIEPLRLESHQRQWLIAATKRKEDGRYRHSVVVASWPKREGKSMCVAIMLAYRMACFNSQRCVILANSKDQAQSNVFDELSGFFRNSPSLQDHYRSDDVQRNQLSVTALNNSVRCVPCNFRTIQGMAVTGILAVDELHAVQDVRAYNYLRGQTEGTDVQTCISSQAGPSVKSNPVWRLYEQREQEHILFSYLQDHVCGWAIRLAGQQKAELTDAEYEILHRNAWGGLGQKLFRREWIEAAAQDWQEPQSAKELQQLIAHLGLDKHQMAIGVGLDRSGKGDDRTAWTVTGRFDDHVNPSQYRVLMCEVYSIDTEDDIVAVDAETRRIFGPPDAISFEEYQCKDIVHKIIGAELRSPTGKQQQFLYNNLWRLFRESRIAYPAEMGLEPESALPGLLKAELLAFEHVAGVGADGERSTRYGTQTGHDDTVYSVAWSCDAVDGVEGFMGSGEGGYARAGAGRKFGPRVG